jgi:hypothetical protein
VKPCKFTLAIALVAFAFLPAAAQSRMQVNVPFAFTVNGMTLPAGHYFVHETFGTDNSTWTIDGDRNFAKIITHSVESPVKDHAPSLIFLKVGESYLLTQIWNESHYGRELQLPETKSRVVAEKKSQQYIEIAAK